MKVLAKEDRRIIVIETLSGRVDFINACSRHNFIPRFCSCWALLIGKLVGYGLERGQANLNAG